MAGRNNGARQINLSPLHVLEIQADLEGTTQTDSMVGRKEPVQINRNHPSHDPQNGGKAHTHLVTDKTTDICFQPQQSAMLHSALSQTSRIIHVVSTITTPCRTWTKQATSENPD
jgi:hypothetical protein